MQKLENLQTLRAIAACLVIICHAIGNYVTWQHLAYPTETVIWNIGKLGVAMFFVISGFIMMFIHHDDFQTKGAIKSFYLKRLVRVVPMYWIFTLLVALKIFLQGRALEIIDLIKSLLFIPYQNVSGLWRPVHDLGWTLNLEMYFYVIFGLALLMKKKIGLFFLFAAIVTPLVLNHYFSMAKFYSDPVVVYFLVGVAIFFIRNTQIFQIKMSGNLFFAVCVTAIASIFSLYASYDFLTIALAVLLPLLAVVCTSATKPLKVISHVGNASYSLYLVHPLIIGILLTGFKKLPVLQHVWGLLTYVLVCLVVSMLVAHAIFIWLELPLVKYFKTLMEK